MSSVMRLMLPAGLVLCLGTLPVAIAEDKARQQAKKVGEEWLALVDAGKSTESWEAAAQAFRDSVSRKQWESQVAAHTGLGKVTSRTVLRVVPLKDPPSAPPGDYFSIVYQSAFEKLPSANEIVVPKLEEDGKWRVSHYMIVKDE